MPSTPKLGRKGSYRPSKLEWRRQNLSEWEIHARRYRDAAKKQSQRERSREFPAAVVKMKREGDMNQSLSWCTLSMIFVLT